MWVRALLISAFAVATGGCASMVTAWKNDPLQSYKIESSSIYAMTGDRRTAIIFRDELTKKNRFCAESLPDAVAAFSAASKANAGVKDKVTAGYEDAAYAGLLQTFQRTEIAEIYRQLGWNMCLAWAQGGLEDPHYRALLTKFADGGLDAIAKRAIQEAKFPPVAPVTLNVGPGGTVEAAVKNETKTDAKPQPKKKDDIPLDGVTMQDADTPSGWCLKGPADYKGGTPGKPPVTEAMPLCK